MVALLLELQIGRTEGEKRDAYLSSVKFRERQRESPEDLCKFDISLSLFQSLHIFIITSIFYIKY